jgi:hypothetical protein
VGGGWASTTKNMLKQRVLCVLQDVGGNEHIEHAHTGVSYVFGRMWVVG